MHLYMFTVYDHPGDFPDGFVVRRFRIDPSGPVGLDAIGTPTIELARACIPDGLNCIPRMDGDDPCIVEVWI